MRPSVAEGEGAAEGRLSRPSKLELGEAELEGGSSGPENESMSLPIEWAWRYGDCTGSMTGGYQTYEVLGRPA